MSNDRNLIVLDEEEPSSHREKMIIGCAIFAFGILGIFSVYDDWLENVSVSHLVLEGAMNLVALGIGSYLLIRLARSKRRSLSALRAERLKARSAATSFQIQIQKFQEGVSNAITQQLKAWKLTPTEEEICLFLLKGLSLQEIADLRNTSERTIRQQASMIYKKTGLGGRTQLSAFFLEDLFTIDSENFNR